MQGGLEWARPATVADLARVRVLWERAARELDERRGGRRLVLASPRPPELDAGEPTRGSGPGARDRHGPAGPGDLPAVTDTERVLVVGGIDDVVLGFAEAVVERGAPVPVAVLRAAYVEEGARGVGIGEAMVELVTEWAGAQGCAGIDAYALPGSRSAKAFFEDQGFVTRLLTMYRPLSGGGRDDGR